MELQMAKKPTAPKFDSNVLANISKNGFVSKDDGLPLLNANPPLIEVNVENVNADGHAQARLTEAGQAFLTANPVKAAADLATAPAKASPYAVIRNAVLPPSKRGNGGGGAPTQYPFDTMEIGESFFVPVSEKHADPVKTLGSTVSSANLRFAIKTTETKQVNRAKRGEGNKAVKDASGNKIMETVTVPVYKHTKKFSIRKVEKGIKYGDWVAPADGALIARVNLPA